MRAAFFDVDETLVSMKSMFVFLRHFLEGAAHEPRDAYERTMSSINRQVSAGASREQINRYFYSLFCGKRQSEVQIRAREIFTTDSVPFIKCTVERLRDHQERGDHVVLVSGAMRDIIFPIGDILGVTAYRCTYPEVTNGFYTGKLRQQAIGSGKADVVMSYCEKHQLDPMECSAYGDHISDAKMLEIVGHAYVVNPRGAMLQMVCNKAWNVLVCPPLNTN